MPYAKRTIMPGYPKEFQFGTREEIDAYFSGDRITCLLCGRDFKSLEPHLTKVHQFTCDEYRERYALPYRRGLCSDEARVRWSIESTRMFEENKDRQLSYLAMAKATQAELGNPQRNKPKFWKSERTRYALSHYEEFVRRVVEDGRAVSSISNDPDMPTITNVYWFMKRNKEFSDKYKAIVPLFAPIGVSQEGKKNRDKKKS